VVLTGPDMLGTVDAIDHFSEDDLGVDPMAHWTGSRRARRGRIAQPARLTRVFPPPHFRDRGVFIHDEDLLTGWAPAPAREHTGISWAVMNTIFETPLRRRLPSPDHRAVVRVRSIAATR
jgi:hypothetical protein